MTQIKKYIIISLENLCTLTKHRWCHILVIKSYYLDKKWNTQVWKPSNE